MMRAERPLNWRHELATTHARAGGPTRVLDVGCGSGWLLRNLDGAARATGLERDPAVVTALRSRGMDVAEGDATVLPFEDRSFDLVVLRNVLHHVEDPAAAVAEALRVARGELLVTEPWFDLSVRSQRLGQSIDSYVKRVERHAGRYHGDYIDADAILDWLGDGGADLRIERHLRLEARPRSEWLADVVHDLAALPEGHPLLIELSALDRALAREPATAEGVLLIRLRI